MLEKEVNPRGCTQAHALPPYWTREGEHWDWDKRREHAPLRLSFLNPRGERVY